MCDRKHGPKAKQKIDLKPECWHPRSKNNIFSIWSGGCQVFKGPVSKVIRSGHQKFSSSQPLKF